MKTSIKIVSAFTVSLLTLSAGAQNEVDALRYSYLGFGGTARYNGMGGAFGALGGDISCMVTNPAGMGRYTKSEFNMSLLYEDINTNTKFLNNTAANGRGNFNLGSLGFVGTKRLSDADWRYFQFGIAYNRTNFFHTRFNMEGLNNTSSMADVFRMQANGYTTDQLPDYFPNSAELAYQAYLIDPMDTTATSTGYTDRVPAGIGVNQSRNYSRSGYMAETSISFSGNYMDKLYVGATIGLPGTRFYEDWSHNETMVDPDSLTSLQSFSYTQTLTTRGRGFNMKVGMIFLPVDWVRIGASVHTPSFIAFTDNWNNTLSTNFEGGESHQINGPASAYTWRLRTPARFMGSLGVIIMKMAALDVDVEYVDYGATRLRRDWADQTGYNFSAENDAIQNNYRGAVNIRTGAEVRLKYFYLRGGYALYQSPYKTGLTKGDAATKVISGGLGFKNKGFSVDLGVNFINYNEDIYPYDPVLFSSTGPAIVDTKIVRTSLTCGWRF